MVSGWQGQVAIGNFPVAYWGICMCLMMGALGSAFNFMSWTRVSSLLMFSLFGFAAATALVAICHHGLHGQVGAGSVIAIATALAGIANLPEELPDQMPSGIPLRDQAQQTYRSAA